MKVPDRRQLGQQMDKELRELQDTIGTYLLSSKYKCSFGVDIATTKGMMLSFLGISAHVWSANGKRIHVFGLDLVELQERHSAAYVHKTFTETLKKFGLNEAKTLRVVTDCGRNMINAFL